MQQNITIPPHIKRLFFTLLIIVGASVIALGGFYAVEKRGLFMVWNMFLAILPLLFSGITVSLYPKWKLGGALSALVWLFFFPNAPYILTDFMHLAYFDFYKGYVHMPNSISWVFLVILVLSCFASCWLGYLSLYQLHYTIAKKTSKRWGWIFVVLVSALSGIALYIGRFFRFNSWDIVRTPLLILRRIWESLNVETIGLYLVFAAMVFGIYSILYASIARPAK